MEEPELLRCRPIKVYRLIWSGRLGAIDLNNDGKPVKPGEKVKRPSWRVPHSHRQAQRPN